MSSTCSSHAPISERGVDRVLHFGHDDTQHREHNQYGKDLLGFQNLPGKIEPGAEPGLSDDHFGCDHKYDRNTQPEAHAREDRRDRARQEHASHDLLRFGTEVARRENKARVTLADAENGIDSDG